MPNRIVQLPYTGVAVVQYFVYHFDESGAHAATAAEVRAILEESIARYQTAHPWRTASMHGLVLQTPTDRGHGVSPVLRVIPDKPAEPPR